MKLLRRIRAGEQITEGFLNQLVDAVNRLQRPGFGMITGSGIYQRHIPQETPFRWARVDGDHESGLTRVVLLDELVKGDELESPVTEFAWNRGPLLLDGAIVLLAYFGAFTGAGVGLEGRYDVISGWPQVYYGKTDEFIAKSDTGTVTIWSGNDEAREEGEPADGTIQVLAYNRFADVTPDSWVHLLWNPISNSASTAEYELTAAECV